jgi:hypothetical protein
VIDDRQWRDPSSERPDDRIEERAVDLRHCFGYWHEVNLPKNAERIGGRGVARTWANAPATTVGPHDDWLYMPE